MRRLLERVMVLLMILSILLMTAKIRKLETAIQLQDGINRIEFEIFKESTNAIEGIVEILKLQNESAGRNGEIE